MSVGLTQRDWLRPLIDAIHRTGAKKVTKGPAGNAGGRCRSEGDQVARNRFASGQARSAL